MDLSDVEDFAFPEPELERLFDDQDEDFLFPEPEGQQPVEPVLVADEGDGSCLPRTVERQDRPQVRFYPFPIYTGSAMRSGVTEQIQTALDEAFGGDERAKSMTKCMMRRWIYVCPAQPRRKAVAAAPGRAALQAVGESSGLLLWDPLYEYTHALCRTADNVPAMAAVLRANMADPRKQPFVYFIGPNKAKDMLWQGAFANEFVENMAGVAREPRTRGLRRVAFEYEAIDDRMFDLLGSEDVQQFLRRFVAENQSCERLTTAFQRPQSNIYLCNLAGKWVTTVQGANECEKQTVVTERFIALAVRQAQAVLRDPAALDAYERRVRQVRQWTGNNEVACDPARVPRKRATAKTVRRAEQPPPVEVPDAPRPSAAEQQRVTDMVRRLMQTLPADVEEGAPAEAPSRKRRTEVREPDFPPSPEPGVWQEPTMQGDFPPTPAFEEKEAEPMQVDEPVASDEECAERLAELRADYERLIAAQEGARLFVPQRFDDFDTVTQVLRFKSVNMTPTRPLIAAIVEYMWDCGHQRVPDVRQLTPEDVWGAVRRHFGGLEDSDRVGRTVTRFWQAQQGGAPAQQARPVVQRPGALGF